MGGMQPLAYLALYDSSLKTSNLYMPIPRNKYLLHVTGAITCQSLPISALSINFSFTVHEPLPVSLSKAAQKAQLRRMLEIRVNPIDGISSKWDYDNDRWKVRIL